MALKRRLVVFCLAFACRMAFSLLVDEPLLYTHQYTYFTGGQRLAMHPDPLQYVLSSDDWRTWDVHWTIAPLYHLFLGAFLRLFGANFLLLRIVQSALDSVTAVAVAYLGEQATGNARGAWAGMLYAVYWPAVEMPSWTMTENLHTVLFVGGVALLARAALAPASRRLVVAGFVLGLSALARSVSTGFLGLAGLWQLRRGGLRPALLLALGGSAAILPWTARNFLIVGDHVLIESTAFENLWWANHLGDQQHYQRQREMLASLQTPAEKRAAALQFAWRGVQRHPDLFVEKVETNFRHFLRPEGLHNLLTIERSQEWWRHLGSLLGDDLLMFAALPLFLVFLAAGRPSPARTLIATWTAYYLFMVIVVFHNEIRYRSALLPFVFAGALGGLAVLRERRDWRVAVALLLGAWLSFSFTLPYAEPALAAWQARRALEPALSAVDSGDLVRAEPIVERATALAPRSARPWLVYGRAVVRAGHPCEALPAYQKASDLASLANWNALVALPRLLSECGRVEPAATALVTLDKLSWNTDPWLVLETAWRELPPPRTEEVRLAVGDYGAVRGFFHPRGGDPDLWRNRQEWNRYDASGEQPPPGTHRWSRHRAWLRALPTQPAPAYVVTLEMGSPFPSPLVAPEVTLRATGGEPVRVTLTRELKPYTLRAAPPQGEPIVVQLDAPTWSLLGEPADQGVRVDRMTIAPAR